MVKLHYNNYTPVYAYALVPTVGPPSFNVSEGLVYIYTQFKTTVFFSFSGTHFSSICCDISCQTGKLTEEDIIAHVNAYHSGALHLVNWHYVTLQANVYKVRIFGRPTVPSTIPSTAPSTVPYIVPYTVPFAVPSDDGPARQLRCITADAPKQI